MFFDTRFQDNNRVCASCHDFSRGGADPRPRSWECWAVAEYTLHVFNSASISANSGALKRYLSKNMLICHQASQIMIHWDESWQAQAGLVSRRASLSLETVAGQNVCPLSRRFSARVRRRGSIAICGRLERDAPGGQKRDQNQELGCVACHQDQRRRQQVQFFGVMTTIQDRGEVKVGSGRYLVTKRTPTSSFQRPRCECRYDAPYFHDASAPSWISDRCHVPPPVPARRSAPDDATLIAGFCFADRELKGDKMRLWRIAGISLVLLALAALLRLT